MIAAPASATTPLDSNIAIIAEDLLGEPIVGANASFRIIDDSTGDATPNPYAEFVASRHVVTGADGGAVNVLRAFGPGTVVVEAEMFDPITGTLVATSNRIILTTTQGTSSVAQVSARQIRIVSDNCKNLLPQFWLQDFEPHE